MVQGGWQLRLEVVRQLLQGALSASEAARRLRCSARTPLGRSRRRFLQDGPDGLRDHRRSNYRKLSLQDELRIVQTKKQGRHRLARRVWTKPRGDTLFIESGGKVIIKHELAS